MTADGITDCTNGSDDRRRKLRRPSTYAPTNAPTAAHERSDGCLNDCFNERTARYSDEDTDSVTNRYADIAVVDADECADVGTNVCADGQADQAPT